MRYRYAYQLFPCRKVAPTHNSFQYFVNLYKLKFLSLKGIHNKALAPTTEGSTFIKKIKKRKINTLFAERMGNKRILQRIAQEFSRHNTLVMNCILVYYQMVLEVA